MPEASPRSPAQSASLVVLLLCLCASASNAPLNIPQRTHQSTSAIPKSDFGATEFAVGEVSAKPGRRRKASTSREATAGAVDVNRASIPELIALPGIGPVLAERIVRHRASKGCFRAVDDIIRVRGIGQAKLEQLRGGVSAGVESQPDARCDGHDEGVEEAVGVGGDPVAARIGPHEPPRADQEVDAE